MLFAAPIIATIITIAWVVVFLSSLTSLVYGMWTDIPFALMYGMVCIGMMIDRACSAFVFHLLGDKSNEKNSVL